MVILIKGNLACNFACRYCYQHPIKPERLNKNPEMMDHEAIIERVKALHGPRKEKPDDSQKITLHGGEPTVLPKDVFERYLKLSFDLRGASGIQTNGYLIDILAEQFRHFPPSKRKLKIGILSNHLIRFLQFGQNE